MSTNINIAWYKPLLWETKTSDSVKIKFARGIEAVWHELFFRCREGFRVTKEESPHVFEIEPYSMPNLKNKLTILRVISRALLCSLIIPMIFLAVAKYIIYHRNSFIILIPESPTYFTEPIPPRIKTAKRPSLDPLDRQIPWPEEAHWSDEPIQGPYWEENVPSEIASIETHIQNTSSFNLEQLNLIGNKLIQAAEFPLADRRILLSRLLEKSTAKDRFTFAQIHLEQARKNVEQDEQYGKLHRKMIRLNKKLELEDKPAAPEIFVIALIKSLSRENVNPNEFADNIQQVQAALAQAHMEKLDKIYTRMNIEKMRIDPFIDINEKFYREGRASLIDEALPALPNVISQLVEGYLEVF